MQYKWSYNGPVLAFDKLATSKWKGETIATTLERAKSNLAYQYKKKNHLSPMARIMFPGEVVKKNAIM